MQTASRQRLLVMLLTPTLLVVSLSLAAPPKQAVRGGPMRYTNAGAGVGTQVFPWRNIASVEETSPDFTADLEEYAKRSGATPEKAAAHIALAQWCEKMGLTEQARKHYESAVALDADNIEAHNALRFAKTDTGWVAADTLYPARWTEAQRGDSKALLDLARWCEVHRLRPQQLAVLLTAIDRPTPELALFPRVDTPGWHQGAIQQVKAIVDDRQPATAMRPPVEGRWQAVVDTSRHHQRRVWNTWAIDFMAVDDRGRTQRGAERSLDDYFGFGQTVYAVADGVVTQAVDGNKDYGPGVRGPYSGSNQVTLQHAGGEFTMYGHMQSGSVTVKTGDRVQAGDPLGRVGNSGASTIPHLHFAVMIVARTAEGKPVYIGAPFQFDDFQLVAVRSAAVDVHMIRARMQEGWTFVYPRP